MLNKNSLRLLKKGVAKQSRINNIVWHLRWPEKTRADISLRPSGLVRPRTDTKLWPSVLVRTRTDINRIGKITQGLIQEQIYMQIFLNCHLATFVWPLETLKVVKLQFKKICMYICSFISPYVILPILLATT